MLYDFFKKKVLQDFCLHPPFWEPLAPQWTRQPLKLLKAKLFFLSPSTVLAPHISKHAHFRHHFFCFFINWWFLFWVTFFARLRKNSKFVFNFNIFFRKKLQHWFNFAFISHFTLWCPIIIGWKATKFYRTVNKHTRQRILGKNFFQLINIIVWLVYKCFRYLFAVSLLTRSDAVHMQSESAENWNYDFFNWRDFCFRLETSYNKLHEY